MNTVTNPYYLMSGANLHLSFRIPVDMSDFDHTSSWDDYYDAVESRGPRELVLEVMEYFSHPGRAIDIGCGVGTETLALAKKGWQVLAVDREQEALTRLSNRLRSYPLEIQQRVDLLRSPIEELDLPAAQLIHASYSLPFCHPNSFTSLWSEIGTVLDIDGIFAGHFFGENDAWNIPGKSINFFTKNEVQNILEPFSIIKFEEEEGMRGTATGGEKYWHTFEIIARKRGNNL